MFDNFSDHQNGSINVQIIHSEKVNQFEWEKRGEAKRKTRKGQERSLNSIIVKLVTSTKFDKYWVL